MPSKTQLRSLFSNRIISLSSSYSSSSFSFCSFLSLDLDIPIMGADSEIPGVVKLKCSVKKYDWGNVGDESTVARLYAKNSGEVVDGAEPYAELWMGSHESGPSYVVVAAEVNDGMINNGLGGGDDSKCTYLMNLKEWIERNPSVLGDKVLKKWGPNLPFLFKVLSVRKALSIQAHPDKDLAAILHKQQPAVYKDGNHKPEMALALTEFEALCGFVGLEELKSVVHTVPEIVEVVGNSCAERLLKTSDDDGENKLKEVLQSLFTGLMLASKAEISVAISKLISRLNLKHKLTEKEELVLRLEKQYPGDVGLIAAFLFNYVRLNPGEALYLGANEPHAYIQGECVECMATSDNVVRAGLTPKNRDVQTLCSMLTYKQSFPEILAGVPSGPYTRKYIPPFDEFEVDGCNLPEEAAAVFHAVGGPSIFVVIAGQGTMAVSSTLEMLKIREGDVLLAAADTEIAIIASASLLNVCRAGVNTQLLGV